MSGRYMSYCLLNRCVITAALFFGAAMHTTACYGENIETGLFSLRDDLEQLRKTKTTNYELRTQHYKEDGLPKYTNRLIREDSPYLLQHAHNPVNWYAWGDEAFAEAKKANKPVFLSIGYSTCHWCHVMEVESFDNEAVAEMLNSSFVSIKVDREQRPDLDEIYMTAVQLFSGRGGWPMSSFLTPEGKPFYGGTYFPPEQFKLLLSRVNTAWSEQEENVRKDADRVAQQVDQYLSSSALGATLDNGVLSEWLRQALLHVDTVNGGFGPAPKFPNESELLFLLDQLKRSEIADPGLRQALSHTLDRMAQGGIYDQVGGGFHRYSTDDNWLVPHFEKMLYNQALLGRVYAESYFLTGNPFHRQIAQETFDYVLRDMTSPSGSFYSATDADSEGEEGTFFLWDKQELETLFNTEDYQFVESLYSVTAAGNFEGRNILFLPEIPKVYESATAESNTLKEWQARLRRIKHQLYVEREKRVHPFKDKKIIAAWNGMMIAGLAKAATFLDESRYVDAARRAADYLWQTHLSEGNDLYRVSLEGAVSIQGTQEDYAYFTEGLLALYDNTGEKIWLDRAQQLIDKMIIDFMDEKQGGFYLSSKETTGPLISKIKSTTDGAIPSGNSVALSALVSIAGKTESVQNQQVMATTLAFLSGGIKQQGIAHTYALRALSESLNGEMGPTITLANGHIRAEVDWLGASSRRFRLRLVMDEGWHINADKISQEDLIPTSVALLGDSRSRDNLEMVYPESNRVSVSFIEEDLSLFEGAVMLKGQLLDDVAQPVKLKLVLQACNEDRCLPPEERTLVLRALL